MPQANRVLVVDDEQTVLVVFRDALAKLGDGYEIVACASGREALERAKDQAFHLLLTDLKMPDMDGVELTEAMMDLHSEIVVIWMTAYDSCTRSADAKRLGVYRCLDKPLEIDEIRQVVREALAA